MRQRIVLSVRAGGSVGQLIELRNQSFQVPTLSLQGEGNIGHTAHGKV